MSRNDFENLQSVYIRTYNKLVRQSFREDIPDDDITTPEAQMKAACLIKDSDSALQMLLKSNMFFMVREEGRRLHPPIYEAVMPDQEPVVNHPQLILRFSEDQAAQQRARRKQPKTVRISFRIMNQTVSQISQSDCDRFQTAIRSQFPNTFYFKTGRTKMSYYDDQRGYRLIIAPHSTAIGERLIDRVLAIQGHSPNWERLTVSEAPRRNFSRRDTVTILGQQRQLPDRRPIADVRLRKATLKLGLEDVVLWETI